MFVSFSKENVQIFLIYVCECVRKEITFIVSYDITIRTSNKIMYGFIYIEDSYIILAIFTKLIFLP